MLQIPKRHHKMNPRSQVEIRDINQSPIYRAGLLLIFRSAHREPLQAEPDHLKCLAVGPGRSRVCVGNRTGRGACIFVEEP
jgi:hypothetical protein